MRMENKFHYLKLGSKDMVQRKFINFTDFITLKGDGVDYTEKLQQLKIETLCFLNIPSYASGTNPWGHPSSEDKVWACTNRYREIRNGMKDKGLCIVTDSAIYLDVR